ncbi:putative quinol monooxygenase [Paenibacillus validus]|uniref:Antibiotic biosynthesis monooxygenase n=1 Tax=Paenibacillus validus TaxID=44253 RepID=A0A7X2ZG31_9BACL|nr:MULTISPECIES: putative quinol monooxygenase [Paenibacillus]MED4600931.1 putative quinol monooxygenase [Paenibacillus validus]MED4607225.1 putative quinol monooxygenase [Paenibacillus validus]MUG73670.1 antibiotic biosynthesis monooxygenase [Paenibacillus validus]
MIAFTATLKAKPGKEKELEEALIHMVSQVQNEEGALAYTLLRAKDDPGQFTFYEKYKDQAAWDFHDNTPHIRELREKFALLVDGEIKLTHYEEIASIRR